MRFRKIGINFIFRMTFWYACIFAAASLWLLVVLNNQTEQFVIQSERKVLKARAREYRAWFEEGGLSALKARFDERKDLRQETFFIRVTGPGRTALWMSIPDEKDKFDFRILNEGIIQNKSTWISLKSYESDNLWHILSTPLGLRYHLQVGSNTSRERELQSSMREEFWKILVPFLLIGLIGGGWLTFRTIRPIQKLSETIQEILRTGNRKRRVYESKNREDLDRLVRSFNKLLDQNDKLIGHMSNSLDNVAHDLRTPMTRLRQSAELALQGENTPEHYREALQDCLEESESILKTLDVLMEVAEAETGAMAMNFETVSLNEMISKLFELYELIAEDHLVTLSSKIEQDIEFKGDRVRMQQAFANLIDNAIKYIGDGKLVEISARKLNDKIMITIQDDGMGIPKEDIPKIWDRLFRGDRSRSKRGLGIGLSFVKAIIEAHDGTIEVQSEVSKGTVFTITLNS